MTFTPLVLTDTKIYLSCMDLTGYGNRTELAVKVDVLDKTTFGSGGTREKVGGLFDTTGVIEGFWQAGDATQPDDSLFSTLGTSIPATWAPTLGATAGDLAYLTKVVSAKYDLSEQIGQLAAWTVDLNGTAPVARGQIAHATGTTRSSSGTGTAVQIGAVGASQRLYANLHVLASTGTGQSLIVKVQTSSTSAFSSPTDQITFSSASAVTGIASSVLGSITDTWARVVYTIAGTSPGFQFVASLGVAAK